jgi:hypothetical protein
VRPGRPNPPPLPGAPTHSIGPPTLSMAMPCRSVEGYAHDPQERLSGAEPIGLHPRRLLA